MPVSRYIRMSLCRRVGTATRLLTGTWIRRCIRYVNTSTFRDVFVPICRYMGTRYAGISVARLPPFFLSSFFNIFSFGVFFPLQDMIPMPAAAAESGLELLLTNLWVGKGEKPNGFFFSFLFSFLCIFFYLLCIP